MGRRISHASVPREGAQRSPVVGVLPNLLHLTQNDHVRHSTTCGGGVMFLGVNHASRRRMGMGLFWGGQPRPPSQEGMAPADTILGVLHHTVWPRATKFGVVINMGRDMFYASATTLRIYKLRRAVCQRQLSFLSFFVGLVVSRAYQWSWLI